MNRTISKTMSLEDIKNMVFCEKYVKDDFAKIRGLLGNRESLTPREVAELDIEVDEKLWVLHRWVGLGEKARLLAADYVEHVLHVFEEEFPGDNRPRKSVEGARRFAKGEIDGVALLSIHRAAYYGTLFHARIFKVKPSIVNVLIAAAMTSDEILSGNKFAAMFPDKRAAHVADIASCRTTINTADETSHEWQLNHAVEFLEKLIEKT